VIFIAVSTLEGSSQKARSKLTKVEPPNWGRYGYLKRAFDIAAAALLLSVALAPLVALVALLVVIDLGPRVVFWQKRPGRFGRPFKLYKFRTMEAAPDRDLSIDQQYRSSRVGRFLRRSRLDELPQLYNVLIGEMSFIGPRPLLPWDQPDDFWSRLSVRPGLTGLAQAHRERDMSPNDISK